MQIWKLGSMAEKMFATPATYTGLFSNNKPVNSIEIAYTHNHGNYRVALTPTEAVRMTWAITTSPDHGVMRAAMLEEVTDDFVAAVNSRRKRCDLDPIDKCTIMSLRRAYLRMMGEDLP